MGLLERVDEYDDFWYIQIVGVYLLHLHLCSHGKEGRVHINCTLVGVDRPKLILRSIYMAMLYNVKLVQFKIENFNNLA